MHIYILYLNKKKYKQYKNFELAYEKAEEIIKEFPEDNLEIILEDYCDYGYSDTSCKFYLLLNYVNRKINKYI